MVGCILLDNYDLGCHMVASSFMLVYIIILGVVYLFGQDRKIWIKVSRTRKSVRNLVKPGKEGHVHLSMFIINIQINSAQEIKSVEHCIKVGRG